MPGERRRPDRDPRPCDRAPDHARHVARGARRRRPAGAARADRDAATSRPHGRHHRAVGARARDPHRAAVRVPRRRGAPEPPHERGHRSGAASLSTSTSIGRLDADAIERVHEEITPEPETARRPARSARARSSSRSRRAEWQPLFDELVARGSRRVVGRAGARAVVRDRDARRRGSVRRRRRRGRRPRPCAATSSSPASPPPTSWRRVRPRRRAGSRTRLARAGSEGFAIAGLVYRRRGRDVEWVSRRLLARMHSYSRRTRRGGVEPATAQDFMRFLLRWQHLAPGTQLAGDDGLATVDRPAAGMGGRRRRVGTRAACARRCATTTPAALDRLCHDGEVGWLRLSPRPRDVDAPAGAPNKATPISVVFRDDLAWLLEAARGGTDPVEPTVGATAEIARGAPRTAARASPTELGAATNRLPEDIERALWDGVARGLAHRPTASAPSAAGRQARCRAAVETARLSRLMRGARAPRRGRRRWSLVPPHRAPTSTATSSPKPSPSCSCTGGASCSATSSLRESIRFPWRDVQRALRRLEDRGLVRGGRFVDRIQRRAVRAPGGGRTARARAQARAHRRTRHRERDRSVQPRRDRSSPARPHRRSALAGSSTSTAFRPFDK